MEVNYNGKPIVDEGTNRLLGNTKLYDANPSTPCGFLQSTKVQRRRNSNGEPWKPLADFSIIQHTDAPRLR
jgi:hypothetical protein